MSAIRFRIHEWINTAKMEPQFGIQAMLSGHWRHCVLNGKVVLFDTREEADRAVEALRAKVEAQP